MSNALLMDPHSNETPSSWAQDEVAPPRRSTALNLMSGLHSTAWPSSLLGPASLADDPQEATASVFRRAPASAPPRATAPWSSEDGFDFPLQTLHEDRASGLDTDSLGSAAVAHLPPGSSHSLLGRRKADHSALGSATGAGPGGGASSVWSLDAEDAAGLFASGFSGSLLGAPGSSAAAAGRRLQHFESQLTGHFQHPPRRALSETFLPGLGSQASGDPWASSTSHLDEGLENLHLDAGFPEVPDVERLLSTSDVSSPASGPARLSHQNDLGTHNQQQEHHLQEAQRRQQQQHQQKHQQQHHQAQHHYQQQSGQPPSSPKNDRHDQSEAEGELQPHHNQMLMHQRPDGSRVSSSRNTTPPPVLAGPGEPAAEPRSRLFHPRPLHPESYQDVPQHATPSMSSGWSAANTHGRESAPAVPVYLQEAYGSFQQPPSSAAGMPRDARHNPMSPFRRSNSAVGTSGFAEHRQAGNGKMNRPNHNHNGRGFDFYDGGMGHPVTSMQAMAQMAPMSPRRRRASDMGLVGGMQMGQPFGPASLGPMPPQLQRYASHTMGMTTPAAAMVGLQLSSHQPAAHQPQPMMMQQMAPPHQRSMSQPRMAMAGEAGPTSVFAPTANSGGNNLDDVGLAGVGLAPLNLGDGTLNRDIRQLQGRVVMLAADQFGSRLLQQKLEEANPVEVQLVFDESLPHAFELSTDIFGNYLIQKLLQVGTSQQRRQLLTTLRGKVAHLSLQMYGCRVVQRAMEVTSQEERSFIVEEVIESIHRLVQDQHANHVMQKCIQVASPEHRSKILEALSGRIASIAVHSYGCRVIQRLLEHCTQNQLVNALEELHQATDKLAYNPYGNYVLQHLLCQGSEDDVHRIATSIKGHVLAMSQHKYASNVVEKCVQYASPGDRSDLIMEACSQVENVTVSSPQGIGQVLVMEPALNMMMRDQFANYVVQRMVECAPIPLQHRLFEIIESQRDTLRTFTYGKHIISKVDKIRSGGRTRRMSRDSVY